jgi:hypothetical protein
LRRLADVGDRQGGCGQGQEARGKYQRAVNDFDRETDRGRKIPLLKLSKHFRDYADIQVEGAKVFQRSIIIQGFPPIFDNFEKIVRGIHDFEDSIEFLHGGDPDYKSIAHTLGNKDLCFRHRNLRSTVNSQAAPIIWLVEGHSLAILPRRPDLIIVYAPEVENMLIKFSVLGSLCKRRGPYLFRPGCPPAHLLPARVGAPVSGV